MTSLLRDAATLLDRYGYLAVAVLVLIEDFGVPVPGETVLILAAARAGSGHLNIVAVAAIGLVAAVLGDNVGYLIGHAGGRPLILRYGRYLLLTPHRLARAAGFMARHGVRVVAVARFVEGLRQLNGIVAGGTRLPWPRFLAANAVGAALWVSVWAGLGYAFGNRIGDVERVLSRYEWYLLGALVAALAGYLAVRRWRRGRTRVDA